MLDAARLRSSSARHIMAVLNATPDSFSDGGRWSDPHALAAQVERWSSLGVAWLDIGGESTRPGADAVDPDQEWERVRKAMRVVQSVQDHGPISVDTRRAAVARKAVAMGARMINDVSGLADPEMAEIAAQSEVELVIGHLRGQPDTMQECIGFQDVLAEVSAELIASVQRATQAGVAPEKIWVDPGLGFGKTTEHCLSLLVAGERLRRETGCRVLIGASRKRFLGAVTGKDVQSRGHVSVAAALLALQHGACMVRVHDVSETLDALVLSRSAQPYVAAVRSCPWA